MQLTKHQVPNPTSSSYKGVFKGGSTHKKLFFSFFRKVKKKGLKYKEKKNIYEKGYFMGLRFFPRG